MTGPAGTKEAVVRLEKRFTVAAPVERAWEELLAIEEVAACVPGLEPRELGGDAGYGGPMAFELGGTSIRCQGTIRPVDADDDEHEATIHFQGREVGGPAIGTATIRSRLAADGGATSVRISAELGLTGVRASPQAVEEGSRQLLDEFARQLEQRMLERARRPEVAPPEPEPAVARPEPAAVGALPAAERAAEPTAARAFALKPVPASAARYAAPAGALLLLLALARTARPSRGRVSVTVRYRW
jgi:carbon monoxide dehydrogenase subunit G